MTMRHRTHSSLWMGTMLLLLTLTHERAFAIDTATRAAGRELAYEGVEAYQAGNYEKAAERLERAYDVLRLPSVALWSARALEKRGQLLEASERYLQATRLSFDEAADPKIQMDAQNEAVQARAALRERIPQVIVEIQGAPPEEVEVTIDGIRVARALYGAGRPSNPGEIEVVATWGKRRLKETVTVAEGEEKQINLSFKRNVDQTPAAVPQLQATAPRQEEQDSVKKRLAPEPSRSPFMEDTPPSVHSWQKPAGWSGVGVGGAALALGGVTGFLAIWRNDRPGPQTSTCARRCRIPSSSSTTATAAAATAMIIRVRPSPSTLHGNRTISVSRTWRLRVGDRSRSPKQILPNSWESSLE